jgi:hypothetical protein
MRSVRPGDAAPRIHQASAFTAATRQGTSPRLTRDARDIDGLGGAAFAPAPGRSLGQGLERLRRFAEAATG